MKRIILICLTTLIVAAGCEYLEPRPIQHLSTDELLSSADYGEGLLTAAYSNLNASYDINSEYYTDNAVPSSAGSNILALGGWTLETNPVGDWDLWYTSISYCNHYLEMGSDLVYSVSNPTLNATLKRNRRAEAFFLRAWYHWKLLQTYGGYASGESEALGIPVITKTLDRSDNLDLPRDTYDDVVAQIVEDLDSAIAVLPLTYGGSVLTDNITNRGRASALAAMALKARVYLYAASPAYGPSTQAQWEMAAQAAYEAIDASGGLTDLIPYGEFNNFSSFDNIWIQPPFSSNSLEVSYYPPSLYGNGVCNPSQNLVEAFPAADGYPVDESAIYDPDDPYRNRDPRLERFIFYNGDNFNETFIRTYEGGADAPGGLKKEGTRTGYYLKKLLSHNVSLTPGDVTSDNKFYVFLGRTELYLNFAEAANEAYGPTDATFGFSAADALFKVREKAGIDSDDKTDGSQDSYLEDVAASGKDDFRELVHNERRIELCFEGFRFWDIRRLNQELNHTVKGIVGSYGTTMSGLIPENIAIGSTPATDFVSGWEDLNGINNGSISGSKYGNWDSADEWRYVEYGDFPSYMKVPGSDNIYEVSQSAVYYWSDGGGVLYPDSIYLEVFDLDLDEWVEVWHDWDGADSEWNIATFTPVTTNKIRLNFKSNTQSCGIREWQVFGVPVGEGFSYVVEDVENHSFQDYMRYVPLPYSQTLIMDNLKQNSGW